MDEVNELLKQYDISEEDLLQFRGSKVINMLVSFMAEENKGLLSDMFTAKEFETVKEYQGRYKQNERIISLIEILKGGSINEQ
jgi:hypothetical protein